MRTNAELREALFAALDGLKAGTIDVSTAKAMSDVSQTIINSARLDIDYARHCGADIRSGFIEDGQAVRQIGGTTGRHVVKEKHPSGTGCAISTGPRGASSLGCDA